MRGADRTVAVVGAGLLFAVAGCSQENPPPSDPVPTQGPAEAFFEAALGFSAEEAAQQSVLMEESIARCMLEQGFEYVPFTSGYHYVDWSQVDPPPGTREFAERFGYGYAAPPDGTVGTLPDANPNDAILEEMSPEEFASSLDQVIAVLGRRGFEIVGSPAAARSTRARTAATRGTSPRTASRPPRRAPAPERPVAVCPTCSMALPATGVCDDCG